MTRSAMVTALLAAVTLPAQAQNDRAAAALEAAHGLYRGLTTLEIDFQQTIVNPMLGAPDTSTGIMFLFPPDRFAMRFTDPAGDRIVADGTWLWLATPSTTPDQVIQTEIPRSGAATPNIFGQFVDRPYERYEVSYLGTDSAAGRARDRIRLVPRMSGMPFRRATLAIERETGLIRELILVEETGQRRGFVFGDAVQNRPIPAQELMYRPGPGVRIVRP